MDGREKNDDRTEAETRTQHVGRRSTTQEINVEIVNEHHLRTTSIVLVMDLRVLGKAKSLVSVAELSKNLHNRKESRRSLTPNQNRLLLYEVQTIQ